MQTYKTEREKSIPIGEFKSNLVDRVIGELQYSPSRINDIEIPPYMMGDCGSCPSCACIQADFQILAVIEAPATVPIMVTVGGLSLTS